MNERPKAVRLSNTTVPSDVAVGDVVGKLACVDEDTGDSHTYHLDFNPDNLFVIDENTLKVLHV